MPNKKLLSYLKSFAANRAPSMELEISKAPVASNTIDAEECTSLSLGKHFDSKGRDAASWL